VDAKVLAWAAQAECRAGCFEAGAVKPAGVICAGGVYTRVSNTGSRACWPVKCKVLALLAASAYKWCVEQHAGSAAFSKAHRLALPRSRAALAVPGAGQDSSSRPPRGARRSH
jgi:hypothetical protein